MCNVRFAIRHGLHSIPDNAKIAFFTKIHKYSFREIGLAEGGDAGGVGYEPEGVAGGESCGAVRCNELFVA